MSTFAFLHIALRFVPVGEHHNLASMMPEPVIDPIADKFAVKYVYDWLDPVRTDPDIGPGIPVTMPS